MFTDLLKTTSCKNNTDWKFQSYNGLEIIIMFCFCDEYGEPLDSACVNDIRGFNTQGNSVTEK